MFKLVSKFSPAGDQNEAIDKLVDGLNNHEKNQVLLGATGTGKTFTIANVIEKTLYHTMTIINLRLMYHHQIHILKKIHQ